jgi:hypothetical protein
LKYNYEQWTILLGCVKIENRDETVSVFQVFTFVEKNIKISVLWMVSVDLFIPHYDNRYKYG